MSNVRNGLVFSFLGKYASKLLNLLSTVLIARLLTPAEIGTFAIASSFVMILAEVKLLGAHAYLIREETLDNEKIRKAYGMTILMCWGIAFSLILSSGSIANFFNHTDLQGVFIILALSFVLAPYISVPDALLARSYRFKEITIIQFVSLVVQIASTILLIYSEAGFYALAWGQLLNMLSRFVLSLYYTRETRIYLPTFTGLLVIAKLGIFTSVANIVRRIHYSLSDLVIGKMGTPTEVGMFSRGMGYIDFISQSVLDGVSGVAQPYMSDMKRRGNDIGVAYIKTTSLLCSLVWPILAVAGFAALPAIRLLFGNQWDVAAPVATILSIWMIIKVICFFSPQLLIAMGFEKMMFIRDVVCFSVLLLTLMYSYSYGLQAMALAFLFSGLVEAIITLLILKSVIELDLKKLFLSLVKPFFVTLSCLSASILIDYFYAFNSSSPLLIFLLLAFIVIPLWLLTTKLFKLQIYTEVSSVISTAFVKLNKR